jgi:signal transduction histidine kinase
MSAMIRDILDYTRGHVCGGIPLKRQPTDLGVISRAVVDEIRAGHPIARIEVETAGKLTGNWDPARIEQALSNLIANAVQHGGPDVRLIASGEDEDDVVVTVRNGGQPIPREQLATVFDAFKRGDAPGGLGLGLFIVREIVHAHEGSVAVTSSAEGTTFSFRLPRGTAGEGSNVSVSGGSTKARAPQASVQDG